MKTIYVDPLIPPGELSEARLMRLSANIGTLTALMDEAQHRGHLHLAEMFAKSRATKVQETRTTPC